VWIARLFLKSNLTLLGYGATIFRPSASAAANIFFTDSTTYNYNISIEGLTFRSINDRVGSGNFIDSMVSNIQGIYVQGVENFTLKDVIMTNVDYGFKTGYGPNTTYNKNVKVLNCNFDSHMSIMIGAVEGGEITNSTINAEAGATKFLHCIYIRHGCKDVIVDNVTMLNAPGAGIHVYTENGDYTQRIEVKNSQITDCSDGIYLQQTYDAIVNNVDITRPLRWWLNLNQNDGSHISYFNIIQAGSSNYTIANTTNLTQSNITVNGSPFTL
jgi:hypothetical protein